MKKDAGEGYSLLRENLFYGAFFWVARKGFMCYTTGRVDSNEEEMEMSPITVFSALAVCSAIFIGNVALATVVWDAAGSVLGTILALYFAPTFMVLGFADRAVDFPLTKIERGVLFIAAPISGPVVTLVAFLKRW